MQHVVLVDLALEAARVRAPADVELDTVGTVVGDFPFEQLVVHVLSVRDGVVRPDAPEKRILLSLVMVGCTCWLYTFFPYVVVWFVLMHLHQTTHSATFFRETPTSCLLSS